MFTVTLRPNLTRELVVAQAHAMVIEGGLDAVSLRGVAARLGVTAPALYAYVDDKVDLLRGVAELEFDRLVSTFEAIVAESAIERIRMQALAYVQQALTDPALFQVMFLFRPDFVAQSEVDELPAASRAFAAGAVAIEAAIADGSLRAGDPFVISLALWAAAHGTASVLLAGINLGEESEQQVIDAVIDNLLIGLSAAQPWSNPPPSP